MVNVRQVKIFPSMDKAAEARALLEEQVRTNSGNDRTSLGQNIVGEMPALVITSIFDDIGALEKDRDALWANQAFVTFQQKLGPMLRQPTEVTISEGIVSTMAATGATQPRYGHQALVYPATGAEPEVRSILEGFAKGQQADGRPYFRMARRLFSATGPVFSMGDSYESLSEFDKVNKARVEKVPDFFKQLGPITRAPMSQELREVLVPFSR